MPLPRVSLKHTPANTLQHESVCYTEETGEKSTPQLQADIQNPMRNHEQQLQHESVTFEVAVHGVRGVHAAANDAYGLWSVHS